MKWKCNDCSIKIDDFDNVWKHVNDFSHTMSRVKLKYTIIDTNIDLRMNITDDEYLFLANCTESEFYNFFIWREK